MIMRGGGQEARNSNAKQAKEPNYSVLFYSRYLRLFADNFFLLTSRHSNVACTLPAAELLIAVQHRLEIGKRIKRGGITFTIVVRGIPLVCLQLPLVFIIVAIDT